MRALVTALAGLALMMALLPVCASATSGPTLTVRYGREGTTFSAYLVAVAGEDGWEVAGELADCPVKLPDDDAASSEWADAASALAAYVALLSPEASASATVHDGQAALSLPSDGLYLVVGEAVTGDDGSVYLPTSALVLVSGDAEIDPKEEAIPPSDEELAYTVTKVWEGGEDARPDSVTIELLRDGEAAGSVELCEENGWSWSWTDEAGHLWQVAETDVPDGFEVSVSSDGTDFTVTNSWLGETDVPADGESSDDSASGGSVPVTGEVLLPIGVCLCAGVAVLLVRKALSRRD